MVSTVRWTAVNAPDSSSRGIPMGLFIGAVRGSSNNVQMTPLTALFTLSDSICSWRLMTGPVPGHL
jgi:hypothetical protein